MFKTKSLFILVITLCVLGCKQPAPPELPEMKAQTGVQVYGNVLEDMNTLLKVYLSEESSDTYYYVKPIVDSTGVSREGEIPVNITPFVRDALADIHHKVAYIEQYDSSDATHYSAMSAMRGQQQLVITAADADMARPNANYVISGAISLFDRNLTSTSQNSRATAQAGGGHGRFDVSASAKDGSYFSRLGVSFNVTNSAGKSVPGRFNAETELWYSKSGMDIGFAILGVGLGYASEATAMHGRHYALKVMSELCTIQIVGRTIGLPYWRVSKDIFEVDKYVIDSWRAEYKEHEKYNELIPYMQAACIASGDPNVANLSITGQLDIATKQAFDYMANKYNVANRQYPNFDLYRALEENRKLDPDLAEVAWRMYNSFMAGGGVVPVQVQAAPAAPVQQVKAVSQPAQTPKPAAVQKSAPAPKPKKEAVDYDKMFENF